MITLGSFFKVFGGMCIVLVFYYFYIDIVLRKIISNQIKKVYDENRKDLDELTRKTK
jgi:hypothetical protein